MKNQNNNFLPKNIHLTKLHYFKKIFEANYSPLCNYANKIIGNKAEAEDIVQNLFIQLYEKQSLINVNNPENYLIRSIKYKCIDYLRQKKYNIEINESHFPELNTNEYQELSEEDIEPLMHYFAAKLPPKTREVFLLSRFNELSYKEISTKLNISVKTVEAQMGRALRYLRELLKQNNYLSIFFSFFF